MRNKIRKIIFILGFVFIGLGIYRGEVGKTFIKAINICLECIGIG
ncbi:CD1871A family CXXC motif-containing protein [Caminicella sporogenes]|nr:CD1871A family CXXC motif-containing protein [Caminicella sporogenes]WIF95794.1 CD1871A family CXXC motif-containing protein [Caminicella sporogenes]